MPLSVTIMPGFSAITSFLATSPRPSGRALFHDRLRRQQGAKAAPPQAMPVKVQTAKSQKVDDTTDYVAHLEVRTRLSCRQSKASSRRSSSLRRTRRGRDSPDADRSRESSRLRSTAREARPRRPASAGQMAQQNYERVSALPNAGVVSKQDLDQARATLDAPRRNCTRSKLRSRATVQLHYYQGVAPRAGHRLVSSRRVGDRVLTTTTLTTVDRPAASKPTIYVPSRNLRS